VFGYMGCYAYMFSAVIKKEWEASTCVILVLEMHVWNCRNHMAEFYES
jgi:hypothetical protein